MDRLIMLSDRLMTIARFIEKGASVADIGTDHGLLPIYLAQGGLCRSIFASDISASPIESAKRSATKHGACHFITFSVAPGLSEVNQAAVDTIVIAGMGGETISKILEGAPWARYGKRLILQPQSRAGELCRFLSENGYAIFDCTLVKERHRIHAVMVVGGVSGDGALPDGAAGDGALPGGGAGDGVRLHELPELELLCVLYEKRDPLFTDYLGLLVAKTKKALEGMKRSGAVCSMEGMEQRIRELEERFYAKRL